MIHLMREGSLAALAALCVVSCGNARDEHARTGPPTPLAARVHYDAAPTTPPVPLVRVPIVPSDPRAAGPWLVGSRTLAIAGLTVEAWYPSTPTRPPNRVEHAYDLRSLLPPAERRRIPAGPPFQLPCACIRDAPVASGRFPVVVFVHGLALSRLQSVFLTAHWASRGMVVLAPELPTANLEGAMAGRRVDAKRQAAELAGLLATLRSKPPAMLAGAIASDRIGLVGHSHGGELVAAVGAGTGVRVVIPMADRGTRKASTRFSSVIMGATRDQVERYSRQVQGYDSSPTPKRLIGVIDAGHMAFSDFCDVTERGLHGAFAARGIRMRGFVRAMAQRGCSSGTLARDRARAIVTYATTAALEEALRESKAATTALARIAEVFSEVDYRHAE